MRAIAKARHCVQNTFATSAERQVHRAFPTNEEAP